MGESPTRGNVNPSADELLDDVFEEITAKVQAGEQVDIEAYARRFPEHVERIRSLFQAIQAMAMLGRSTTAMFPLCRSATGRTSIGPVGRLPHPPRGRPGRDGGGVRGGAGFARSPFGFEGVAICSDVGPTPIAAVPQRGPSGRGPGAPNIVHIHSVGCERGIHYYAMEFVEGRTLAQVIEELRQLSGPRAPADEPPGVSQLTQDLVAGRFGKGSRKPGSDDPTDELAPAATPQPPVATPQPSASGPQSLAPDTKREAQAAVSTKGPNRTAEFFRSAAQLGIQAAEALEHAHQMGVVHRDIKPSNLMVDASGHLWITDFGLAMTQKDPALTMTGDIVGTLRYMSPEQALGNRQRHGPPQRHLLPGRHPLRTLTLVPAFSGEDRDKLIRMITEEEPSAPSQSTGRSPRTWRRSC